MLSIRMRRMGSKKRAFYRVVVADSRTPRDSRFVEVVGHYNPRTRPATLRIDRERVAYWIGKGARPSDTVRTLLTRYKADSTPATGQPSIPAGAAPEVEAANATE